jgi:hypothetical protein
MNSNIQTIGSIVSFLVFSYGVFLLYKRSKYRKSGLKVNGLISDLIWERGNCYPVVTFTTLAGLEIKNQYAIGINISTFKKGDAVEILYMEPKPENYIINSGVYRYIGPVIMVIGLLGMAILNLL